VETLRFVLEAQSFGFTLNEIGQSLEATEGSELRCADAIVLLSGKLSEIDAHIRQSQALRARLLDTVESLPTQQAANNRAGRPAPRRIAKAR
jgi:MerR family copper efflux transcriptional regulator